MKLSLDRLLQSQGFGSRRACRELIRRRAVVVHGEPAADPQTEVETDGFTWTIDGERWLYRERLYLALHKPQGSECSRNPSHHASVLELLPGPFVARGVQPVGRLDQDSTGLLLLSDDGSFIHAHTSPRRRVSKTYIATIADQVTPPLIASLKAGVKLRAEPGPVAPAGCRQVDDRRLEIVLEQGKYHQVKRMLAAAGTHCVALHRAAIGSLDLDALDLPPGSWCHLDEAQRGRLIAAAPRPPAAA